GIFFKEQGAGRLAVLQPVKGTRGKDMKLLYTLLEKPEKQRKVFRFFDVAAQSINASFSKHFGDLIANGGNDRPLYGHFTWASGPPK
ncbi:MAG: hypothetical protein LBC63_09540, partial [Holophagales bacterium]|nr:hypothetical protein [Holophagales bacterium]